MKWFSYSYSKRPGNRRLRERVPLKAEYEYEFENAVCSGVWQQAVVAFSEKSQNFAYYSPTMLKDDLLAQT